MPRTLDELAAEDRARDLAAMVGDLSVAHRALP